MQQYCMSTSYSRLLPAPRSADTPNRPERITVDHRSKVPTGQHNKRNVRFSFYVTGHQQWWDEHILLCQMETRDANRGGEAVTTCCNNTQSAASIRALMECSPMYGSLIESFVSSDVRFTSRPVKYVQASTSVTVGEIMWSVLILFCCITVETRAVLDRVSQCVSL